MREKERTRSAGPDKIPPADEDNRVVQEGEPRLGPSKLRLEKNCRAVRQTRPPPPSPCPRLLDLIGTWGRSLPRPSQGLKSPSPFVPLKDGNRSTLFMEP